MPTLNLQVAAGGDDGIYGITPNTYFATADTNAPAGNSVGGFGSWFRFTGVSGLNGQQILSATLSLWGNVADTGSPLTKIRVERATAPANPTNQADAEGRTKTTAQTSWSSPGLSISAYVDSPSLVSVLQELANSFDPSVIIVYWEDNGGATGNLSNAESFDHAAAHPAKLTITYGPKQSAGQRLSPAPQRTGTYGFRPQKPGDLTVPPPRLDPAPGAELRPSRPPQRTGVFAFRPERPGDLTVPLPTRAPADGAHTVFHATPQMLGARAFRPQQFDTANVPPPLRDPLPGAELRLSPAPQRTGARAFRPQVSGDLTVPAPILAPAPGAETPFHAPPQMQQPFNFRGLKQQAQPAALPAQYVPPLPGAELVPSLPPQRKGVFSFRPQTFNPDKSPVPIIVIPPPNVMPNNGTPDILVLHDGTPAIATLGGGTPDWGMLLNGAAALVSLGGGSASLDQPIGGSADSPRPGGS